MKIVWVTNSPTHETGFGQQARLMIEGLAERGHTSTVVCRPHPGIARVCEEVHVENYQWEPIDQEIARIQPDAVICFEGHGLLLNLMQMRVTPSNCPVFFWWPFEGSTVPVNQKNCFSGVPDDNLIHLAKFGQDLWKHGNTVIPHCHHPDYKKLPEDKITLRKKWAKRLKIPLLESSLLVLNVNRNFFHKGWDDLFYTIAQIKDDTDVQLLCHTQETFDESRGGFDLPKMAKLYGIEDEVIFTGRKFTTAELNEIYNMVDVQVDLSHGEGFGLTVLECKAAGTPQILSDHTTMSEVAEDDLRIKPSSYSYRNGTTWAQPDALRVAEILKNWDTRKYTPLPPDSRFDHSVILDQWEETLQKPYDGWRDHRYGYQARNGIIAANQTAARLCKIMKWSAMSVGCYDGSFLDWGLSFGIKCFGIEIPKNLGTLTPRSESVVTVSEHYDTDWPETDCLILTNVQDIIFGDADAAEVAAIMAKVQSYDHIILLQEPCFQWGSGRFNTDQLKEYLKVGGLEQKHELELLMRKKMVSFKHEIWSTGLEIPSELR